MGVSEILERWGGRGGDVVVARELRVPYGTVVAWRRRGRIPVDRWKELIALGRAHGLPPLDYADLVEACTQDPPPRTRSKQMAPVPADPQGAQLRCKPPQR